MVKGGAVFFGGTIMTRQPHWMGEVMRIQVVDPYIYDIQVKTAIFVLRMWEKAWRAL